MPRLLLLTQYFPPEIGAAQTRLFELGHELSNLGWDVEVLTALPNYPTGRVFHGYNSRKPVQEKLLDDFQWFESRSDLHRRGFLNRLICYYSFVMSAMRWGRHCVGSRMCYSSNRLHFSLGAAASLSKHWRIPFVFNVSDLWPESAKSMRVVKTGYCSIWPRDSSCPITGVLL